MAGLFTALSPLTGPGLPWSNARRKQEAQAVAGTINVPGDWRFTLTGGNAEKGWGRIGDRRLSASRAIGVRGQACRAKGESHE